MLSPAIHSVSSPKAGGHGAMRLITLRLLPKAPGEHFRSILCLFSARNKIMSRSADDREGLSPSPANILDYLGEEDEDDDLYEPAAEQSDLTTSAAEEDDEGEFAGQIFVRLPHIMLMRVRCA